MTNFEKHKSKIFEIAAETNEAPAMKDGILVACRSLSCKECDFNEDNCVTSFFNWLYENDGEHDGCDGCKYEYKREDESPCTECCNNYTSKWERRPKKTRQDEFLERYPHARTCDGVVEVCPKSLDIFLDCKLQGFSGKSCTSCCKDHWLQEVEE